MLQRQKVGYEVGPTEYGRCKEKDCDWQPNLEWSHRVGIRPTEVKKALNITSVSSMPAGYVMRTHANNQQIDYLPRISFDVEDKWIGDLHRRRDDDNKLSSRLFTLTLQRPI